MKLSNPRILFKMAFKENDMIRMRLIPLAVGMLEKGFHDSLYGRSKGGVTPSGWR